MTYAEAKEICVAGTVLVAVTRIEAMLMYHEWMVWYYNDPAVIQHVKDGDIGGPWSYKTLIDCSDEWFVKVLNEEFEGDGVEIRLK